MSLNVYFLRTFSEEFQIETNRQAFSIEASSATCLLIIVGCLREVV